jgi:murein DD-endopeptidase MepM/ murein hydrolase activator NlpD
MLIEKYVCMATAGPPPGTHFAKLRIASHIRAPTDVEVVSVDEPRLSTTISYAGDCVAFIIVAAGPLTACRMRTVGAGRALACILAIVIVLASGCIALGYGMAQANVSATTSMTAVDGGYSPDLKRPEGLVVADRIGDMSGRLIRLEIETAELARRLDYRPQGGPLLPLGNDAPTFIAAAPRPVFDDGTGLSHVEMEIELLEASLDHMAGVLADRDLTTMAYPSRPPVQGRMPEISSGFGVRRDPFTGRLARHMGLDIPAAHGTAVLASGGGRVLSAGFRGPYGKAIVIDHGHGLQTLYGHCSKLYVRAGELVMPQQKIAAVGSTGRSTGPHLHFEVISHGKRVAPGQVLESVLARNPQ